MAFSEANYRRLRAYLLVMPKFDWWTSEQENVNDYGCVACACVRLTGNVRDNQEISTSWQSVRLFIGCDEFEARMIYFPNVGVENGEHRQVSNAIARLDEVAARYGVTPEPPIAEPQQEHCAFTPNPDAFLAELRAFASETRAAYPVADARLQ